MDDRTEKIFNVAFDPRGNLLLNELITTIHRKNQTGYDTTEEKKAPTPKPKTEDKSTKKWWEFFF